MKNARYTAVQALMRMQKEGAYSNMVLDSLLWQNALDLRDGAFASALFYTALERMLTIDHVLRHYSARPIEKVSPDVLCIMRTGIAQLAYMDGVDDYAAVSESVNLVKEFGKEHAAGYVNVVLRSFIRDNKAIPTIRGGKAAQLSLLYSCPEWLIAQWISAYGDEAALRMLERSMGRPPMYLRVNTTRTDARTLCELLREESVECGVEETISSCVYTRGRVAVEELSAFKDGLFHVQDKASQICAVALGALPGERVLDVCAAPGGKSFTIAEQMSNTGTLIARDLHEKRAGLVREGAKRLGLNIIEASRGDASQFDVELGLFDRVLCDVPCSGFGIIRRKPEIKYKAQESIKKLPDIQYKILQTSAQYLRVGGRLLYSTCTLLPVENEGVVERFLKENAEFKLISETTYTGENDDTDGFFTAVMEKN